MFDAPCDKARPPPKPPTPKKSPALVLGRLTLAATPKAQWTEEKASKPVEAAPTDPVPAFRNTHIQTLRRPPPLNPVVTKPDAHIEIIVEEEASKTVEPAPTVPVKPLWVVVAQINSPAGGLLSGIITAPAATVEKAPPEEQNQSMRARRKEGESTFTEEEGELPTMSSEAGKQEDLRTSRILLPVFQKAEDLHTTTGLPPAPQPQKKAPAPVLRPLSPASTMERTTLEEKNKRKNMLREARRKKKRCEERRTKMLISAAEEDELLPNMTADTQEHEHPRARRIMSPVSRRAKDLLTQTKLKLVPQRVEYSHTTTDPQPVPHPQKTAALTILKRPPAAATETAPTAIASSVTASEEKNKRKNERRKERQAQESSFAAGEDKLLVEMRTGAREQEKPRTKRKSRLVPRQSDDWRVWIKTTPVHQDVEDDQVKTRPTKVPEKAEWPVKDQWNYDAYDTLEVILEAIQGLLYHGSEAHSDIEDTVMGLHELTPMLTTKHLQSAQQFVHEEFQKKMEAMHESKGHLDRIGRRLKEAGIKNNADLVAYRKAMLKVLLPKEKAERRAAVGRREEEREAKILAALSPAKREEKKREAREEAAEMGAQMPERKKDRKSNKVVDTELSSWVGILEKRTGIKRDQPLVPQWKRKQAVPESPPNATQHIAHQGSAAAQRGAPSPFVGAVERQVAEIRKGFQQVKEQVIQEAKARTPPGSTYDAEIEATHRAAQEFMGQTAKTFRTPTAPDARFDLGQMDVIRRHKATAAPPGAVSAEFQTEAIQKAASELNSRATQNHKITSKSDLGVLRNAAAAAPSEVTRRAVQEAAKQVISAAGSAPAALESFQITAGMFNTLMSRISQLEAGTATPTPSANPQLQVSPEPSGSSRAGKIPTEESVRSSRPSGRKKKKK